MFVKQPKKGSEVFFISKFINKTVRSLFGMKVLTKQASSVIDELAVECPPRTRFL